jgi:hypothetical protein
MSMSCASQRNSSSNCVQFLALLVRLPWISEHFLFFIIFLKLHRTGIEVVFGNIQRGSEIHSLDQYRKLTIIGNHLELKL